MTAARDNLSEDSAAAPAVGSPLDRQVRALCAHCRRPIVGNPARHYGTHVSHTESECMQILHAEIDAMRAALEWYADEARACAKNSGSARHEASRAMLAIVTVLALDGGKRADDALRSNVAFSGAPTGHSSNRPAGGTSAGMQG